MQFEKGHSEVAAINSRIALVGVLLLTCGLSCSSKTSKKTTEAKTTEAKTTEAKTTEAKTTEAKTTEKETTVAATTKVATRIGGAWVTSAKIEATKSGKSYVIRGTATTFPAIASRKFELVVRDSKGEVARKPLASNGRPTEIPLKGFGAYAAEIVEAKRVYESETFLYAMTYCVGGKKKIRLLTGGSSFVRVEDDDGSSSSLGLYVYEGLNQLDDRFWLALRSISGGDGWPSYKSQWYRDGKLVHTDSDYEAASSPLRIEADEDEYEDEDDYEDAQTNGEKDCPVGFIERRIEVPEELSFGPGQWVLKIYSRDGPHYELSFKLMEGQNLWKVDMSLKAITKVPKAIVASLSDADTVLPEVWSQEADTPMASQRIVRAVLRKRGLFARLRKLSGTEDEPPEALIKDIVKHGAPWTEKEAVWNVASKYVEARTVTDYLRHDICHKSDCDAFPLVSLDGRDILTNERVESKKQDPDADECDKRYDYPVLVNGKPTTKKNQDLIGYRAMNCTRDDAKLLAGFRIEREEIKGYESGYHYIIVDPDGKTVAEATSVYGIWDDVCVAVDVRAVAIRTAHESSHCYGDPAADFVFMHY